MSTPVLTVEQVAERLRLHPKTILRFIREGKLKATRIGRSYRILGADLEALAGVVSAVRPAAMAARTTAIVDIAPIDLSASERIATFLNAALMGPAGAGDEPVRVQTSFDPQASAMKIVLIGPPGDTGRLLQMVELRIEQMQ